MAGTTIATAPKDLVDHADLHLGRVHGFARDGVFRPEPVYEIAQCRYGGAFLPFRYRDRIQSGTIPVVGLHQRFVRHFERLL